MGVKASYGMGLPMLNKMSIHTFFTRVAVLPVTCVLPAVSAWVKYGGRSPKFIGAPCHVMCAQLYSLFETAQLPPSPRIWTRITWALLVSKERRHLFVIPCVSVRNTCSALGPSFERKWWDRSLDFLLYILPPWSPPHPRTIGNSFAGQEVILFEFSRNDRGGEGGGGGVRDIKRDQEKFKHFTDWGLSSGSKFRWHYRQILPRLFRLLHILYVPSYIPVAKIFKEILRTRFGLTWGCLRFWPGILLF